MLCMRLRPTHQLLLKPKKYKLVWGKLGCQYMLKLRKDSFSVWWVHKKQFSYPC